MQRIARIRILLSTGKKAVATRIHTRSLKSRECELWAPCRPNPLDIITMISVGYGTFDMQTGKGTDTFNVGHQVYSEDVPLLADMTLRRKTRWSPDYVNYDARPGDVILLHKFSRDGAPRPFLVTDTYPAHVDIIGLTHKGYGGFAETYKALYEDGSAFAWRRP